MAIISFNSAAGFSVGDSFTTVIDANANISGNTVVANNIASGAANISGNISADYFIGNGSLLTGIVSSYGNSNVAAYLPTYTGNISATNFIGDGSTLSNINAANISNYGNIIPSADNTYFLGNATNRWANLWLGPGTIYITDSANTANTAELTVTNGVLQVNGATGLQSNLVSGSTAITLANSGNITMTVAGTSNALAINDLGVTTNGYFSAVGNISCGNLRTTGIVLSSGTIAGANITSPGSISAFGNITGGNISTAGNVTSVGNISCGNISATGNVTSGNFAVVGNLSVTGNIFATPIYGSFWSNVTQNTVANTVQTLSLNNIDGHNAVVLGNGVSNSQIIINHAGTYNIQFSVQLYKTSTSLDSVYIWLRKNGQDIANTAGYFSIDRATAVVQSWNFLVDAANVGDYIEIATATSDATISFPAYPAQTTPFVMPQIPSVIVTVTPVGA
jgi:hypothetical protein